MSFAGFVEGHGASMEHSQVASTIATNTISHKLRKKTKRLHYPSEGLAVSLVANSGCKCEDCT